MPLTYEERMEKQEALLEQFRLRMILAHTLRVSLGHLQLPATEIEQLIRDNDPKGKR